jgi:putative spermidine/putrescine transport system substrate-binding protein
VGLVAGLAGCGGGGSRWTGRYLTVVTTGGALRQALYSAALMPFQRTTGGTVHDVSLPVGEILSELRRQALAGRMAWDAVVLDAPHAALAAQQTPGLFAPVGGGEEAAPFAIDALALACRTGVTGKHLPTTWAGAWSADLPGARLWPQDPVGLLEVALLADGVAPGALYPLDLDRAFRSLDRLRALAPAWWQLSEEAGEALAQDEADVVLGYGGELRGAIGGGADATLAPLPVPVLTLALALPRKAPNADVARDFVSYLRGGEAQAALRKQGYGAAGSSPPSGLALDVGWWREQGVGAMARFEAWFGAGERGERREERRKTAETRRRIG